MKSPLFALVLLVAACDSHALGHLAGVEVLNRDTGQTLPVYRARGEYWVAGTPGARYAVVIHNQAGERLLAVASVDGVNVISGETAAYDQTGYVFAPGQQYAIEGWRKSNREVAAFNFTALPDSYAARTGRRANVGVIGVALFLERRAPPPAVLNEDKPQMDAAQAASPGARASAGDAPRREVESSLSDKMSRLGTGHGAREPSYVAQTDFERRSSQPGEIIRIRYDRYENLVAMGVVRSRPRPVVPNPFPDSGQDRFVPDPPGL